MSRYRVSNKIIYPAMGDRIDQLLYDRNINNTELARIIGCERKSIYRIKEGYDTSFNKIVKIANYFNVSLDWLVYGKDRNGI